MDPTDPDSDPQHCGYRFTSQDRYLGCLYDGEIVELSEARAHPAAYSRGAEQQARRHHPLQLGEGGLLGQLRHLLPRLTILIPGQPVIHQPLQWRICSRFENMKGAKSFNFLLNTSNEGHTAVYLRTIFARDNTKIKTESTKVGISQRGCT
jgi:hypothetical protein